MPRLFEMLFLSARRAPAPMAGAGVGAPQAPSNGRPMSVPPVRMLSLATPTRDYARSVENMTFDRLRTSDLARFWEPMGADLWGWQYARRLTGQSAWRARPDIDEGRERALAARISRALSGISASSILQSSAPTASLQMECRPA